MTVAALDVIDRALPGTTHRDMIPADEVQTLLLDLRNLLAPPTIDPTIDQGDRPCPT